MSDSYRVGADLYAAMTGKSDQPVEGITHRDFTNSRTSVITGFGVSVDRNDAQGVSTLAKVAGLERLTNRYNHLVERLNNEPVDENGYPRNPEAVRKLKLLMDDTDESIKYETMMGHQKLREEKEAAEAKRRELEEEINLQESIRQEKLANDLRKRNGG